MAVAKFSHFDDFFFCEVSPERVLWVTENVDLGFRRNLLFHFFEVKSPPTFLIDMWNGKGINSRVFSNMQEWVVDRRASHQVVTSLGESSRRERESRDQPA